MATGKIVKPIFIKKEFSYKFDIGGWSSKNLTQTNFGWSVPEGYEYFSFYRMSTGSSYVWISRITPNNTNICRVYNFSSGTVSDITARIRVYFVLSSRVIETV